MPNVKSPLSEAARKFPNRPAVIGRDQSVTFFELDQYVQHAMDRLIEFKIHPGSRIALILPNSVEYIVLLIALWRLRAVACLISTRLPPQGMENILKQIDCQTLISKPGAFKLPSNKSINKLSAYDLVKQFNRQNIKRKKFVMSLEQDATIMFTSGTTETPKAVVLAFGNHYYNALGSNQNIALEPNDRWLLSLPLNHVGGLGVVFRTLLAGAALVIPPDGLQMIKAIKKFKVTHLSLVPTQLYRLFYPSYNFIVLAKLKAILIGGGPMPHAYLERALQAKLPIYKTYGLTEMGSQVATSLPGQIEKNIILPYRQLRIDGSGEIQVKGETLFKGYLRKNKVELPLTPDGWFQTGDAGSLASDGTLMVTGRKDNMFISGGENIYPEEIEQALCNVKGIEEAAVVVMESKEFGKRPIAVMRQSGNKKLTSKYLQNALIQQLPKFKIPDMFYLWPTTSEEDDLKVSRHELLQFVRNQKPIL